MIHIWWDEAGYPDDASIKCIPDLVFHDFEVEVESAWNFLKRVLKECSDNNCSGCYFVTTPDYEEIHFMTGGWSGAEELIFAIQKNVWLHYYLFSWQRGGLYVFRKE